MGAAIEISGLRVEFGAVTAVAGLDLTVRSGAITALLGPNGAGKTTTVDVITGLRPASTGVVHVLGAAPGSPGVAERCGVMLQTGGLSPTARPLEWLTYLARLYPNPGDPRAVLDLVGLDPSSRTTSRRLSGGEQQRLKLAAALLPQPELLILDEPTAGMDSQARRQLLDELGRMRDHGVTVLLTTHVLADVEELADHVVVMARGRLIAEGTLADLTGASAAVTFDGPADLPVASLAEVLPASHGVTEVRPGTYLVRGEPTPEVIAAITAWCAAHGVLATGLRVGDRSLEQLILDAAEQP